MLTEQQLKNRAGKIGMSDIPTILGQNNFKTPARLAGELIGVVARSEAGLAARVGNHMEELIGREGAAELGVAFNPDGAIERGGVVPYGESIYHPEHEWLVCHCDFALVKNHNPAAVIEVKNVGPNMRDRWGDPSDGIAGIPDYVVSQVIGQCGMTGIYDAYVFAYFGGNDLRVYHFDVLPSDWLSILDRLRYFWGFVEKRKIPPVTACEDMKWAGLAFLELAAKNAPTKHVASETVAKKIFDYKKTKAELKDLQARHDELKTEIQDTMRDCQILTDPEDKPLVTWKQSKAGKSFNQDALVKAYAELRDLSVEEVMFSFTTERPGTRVFLVK